jgi:hypothetical protein
MKKYEIYLPLKYNGGTEIEPEKLKQIRQRLVSVFGAVTVSPLSAPFQGTWRYGGVEFVDDIIRFEIIAEHEFHSNLFFKDFKETTQTNSPAVRHIDYSSEHRNCLKALIRVDTSLTREYDSAPSTRG